MGLIRVLALAWLAALVSIAPARADGRLAPQGGTITVVTAGNGLAGGGTGGPVSLALGSCPSGQGWLSTGSVYACTALAAITSGTAQRLAAFTPDGAHIGNSDIYGDTTNHAIGITGAPLPTFALSVVNASKFGIYLRTCSTCGPEQPTIIFDSGVSGQPVRSFFSSEGVFTTNAWMTISGGFHAIVDHTTGVFGISSLGLPTTEPYMLGVQSDVDGPTVVIKGSSDANNYLLEGLNVAGQTTLKIEKSGDIAWGAGTLAGVDAGIRRLGAASVQVTDAHGSRGNLTTEKLTAHGADDQILLVQDDSTATKFQVGTNSSLFYVPVAISVANAQPFVVANTSGAVNVEYDASGGKALNVSIQTNGTATWENRSSSGNTQFYSDGTVTWSDYNSTQAARLQLTSTELRMYGNARLGAGLLGWSGSTPNTTPDVCLTRNAAGVLEVDSCSAGSYAGLKVSTFVASSTGSFGGAVAMGSNKITGLANGTASNDAAAFGQISAAVTAAISGTSGTTAKFTGPNTIGNGWALDNGTTWGVSGKFTITEANGNTAVNGTLTADAGLRVFDVAGTGLTSSTNTVSLNIAGASCSAGSHMSALTATGAGSCTADAGPGTGTAGKVPYWATSSTLGDSPISVATSAATVSGSLTTTGAEYFTGVQSSATAGNDFALASTTSTLVLTGSSLTLTGMQGCTLGRTVRIIYEATLANDYLTIANNSGSSTSGYRFIGGDGAGVYISNGEGATVVCDSTANPATTAWRFVGIATQHIFQVDSLNDATFHTDAYIAGSFHASSSSALYWGSGGYYTTPDTGIARNAAGIVEINNGTAGTFRDLQLRNLSGTGTLSVSGNTQLGDAQTDVTTIWGNIAAAGSTPTLGSNCNGTGTASIVGTNMAGTVTLGASGTINGCSINWAGTRPHTPYCLLEHVAVKATPDGHEITAQSAATTTWAFASDWHGDSFNYMCPF